MILKIKIPLKGLTLKDKKDIIHKIRLFIKILLLKNKNRILMMIKNIKVNFRNKIFKIIRFKNSAIIKRTFK